MTRKDSVEMGTAKEDVVKMAKDGEGGEEGTVGGFPEGEAST